MSRFLLGHEVQTHNNSLANVTRGVGERVLFRNKDLLRPVAPRPGIFERKLASYRESLYRHIGFQAPVARDVFPSFYKGPRRKVYEDAVASLENNPVCSRDAMLRTFVKAEKHIFTLKPDPAPRVIQPRHPRFNVEVGRFLRPLEERMYDAIDDIFKAPTIMSKYNSFTQAQLLKEKWDAFRDPVCVGMDASRFDQHVSKQALEFEHSIYNKIFKSDELARLLKMQLYNRGVANASDGWFRYKVEGSRMSGDMNTSMGNKILMCLMCHHYLTSLKIPFQYANNGDDCLIFLERKHLKKLENMKKTFRDFGFDVVCEDPVTEFEEVEFCQTKPVCCNGTWRMVRKPLTCFTKDVTAVNIGHDVAMYRRLLNDVGNCGLATAADVPIMGSFYRMLKRFGVEGKLRHQDIYGYYYRSSQNAKCEFDSPDERGRYSYWKMTGISPDAQIAIENYFDSSVWGGDNRQVIDILLPI